MNPISSVAPNPQSEKRKFLRAQTSLSVTLENHASQIAEQSLFATMPAQCLQEEAATRQMVHFEGEDEQDFRLRLARTEEWKVLAGTCLGIDRFLAALGYPGIQFEKGRLFGDRYWNEVCIHLPSRGRGDDNAQYLPFFLEHLKPAIARFHIFYRGQVHVPFPQSTGKGRGKGWCMVVHGRRPPCRCKPSGRAKATTACQISKHMTCKPTKPMIAKGETCQNTSIALPKKPPSIVLNSPVPPWGVGTQLLIQRFVARTGGVDNEGNVITPDTTQTLTGEVIFQKNRKNEDGEILTQNNGQNVLRYDQDEWSIVACELLRNEGEGHISQIILYDQDGDVAVKYHLPATPKTEQSAFLEEIYLGS